MKNIVDFLNEQLEERVIVFEAKIESEEDFREAARKKFEEVFGDELDEDKMKDTIDGILKDNDDLVKDGKWGELMGILNKSFSN